MVYAFSDSLYKIVFFPSLPTIATESVLLSCLIDAMEDRDVATINIPRAFMQVDMDDVVHMKLEGKWQSNLFVLTRNYTANM